MSTLNEAGQRLGLLEAVISGGDAGDDELREYVMLLIAQRASPEPEPAQSAPRTSAGSCPRASSGGTGSTARPRSCCPTATGSCSPSFPPDPELN